MKPRLISFKLCPFVQRVALVLSRKRVEYNVEYIDIADPPEWFIRVSPLKKVPVLVVGERAIFESTVISEFIDEVYPNRLHPEDAFLRAMNRSWISVGNECMADLAQLMLKKSEGEFYAARDALLSKFDRLEPVVRAAPFFNGANFSLVDAAYAPLFQRLDYVENLCPCIYDGGRHSNIRRWKTQLLADDVVGSSGSPDMQELFHAFLRSKRSYLAQFLTANEPQSVVE